MSRLLAGSALGLVIATPVAAGEAPAPQQEQEPPEQIIVTGQRPDNFKIDAPAISRLTEPLLNTPQTIDVISTELLQDRAIASLDDALRNVPGISLGAGEFSWQGNTPTIRGFLARNDIFLDGIRDFGSYTRDPFNLEDIQVLQGPSSILFGRGSTGGVINQASKRPMLNDFVAGTLVGGTDYTRRATVDFNEALPSIGAGAAFRFNAMVHAQSVAERNVAKQERFALAPSLALGIGTPTRLNVSFFDQHGNDVPDYGLPWYGTIPAPVPRQNFYGFDTDFLKTGADIGTVTFEHDFVTPIPITVRNTARYAYYTRSFRISEPIIEPAYIGTPLSDIPVGFNIWSGDSIETMAWDQLETISHFNTGSAQHTLVLGMEGGRESSAPEFDNSAGVPTVPLLNPDPHRPFSAAATFPRVIANTVGWSFAAYAIDTIKFGEQWEINGGVRWDYFKSHYRATRYSTTSYGTVTGNDDVERTDTMPSYRAALVYKPAFNGSIYVSFGTSFNPSAEALTQITSGRGLGIGNSDLAPEENQTYELGTKWDVMDNMLSLTASIFRLEKTNARQPDPNNAGFNILAGGQRVDGFDVGVLGRLTENWQVSAGYTFLDGQVSKSTLDDLPAGSPLPNTPKNSFSFFTEYRLTSNFEIGGGGQTISSRYAQNVLPSNPPPGLPLLKQVPGYWTFDLMAKYDFSEKVSLQLNVNNIFNKFYYDGLHPWHVIPGAGRTALLTLNFRY